MRRGYGCLHWHCRSLKPAMLWARSQGVDLSWPWEHTVFRELWAGRVLYPSYPKKCVAVSEVS